MFLQTSVRFLSHAQRRHNVVTPHCSSISTLSSLPARSGPQAVSAQRTALSASTAYGSSWSTGSATGGVTAASPSTVPPPLACSIDCPPPTSSAAPTSASLGNDVCDTPDAPWFGEGALRSLGDGRWCRSDLQRHRGCRHRRIL